MQAANQRSALLTVVACSYEGLTFGWDVNATGDDARGQEEEGQLSAQMAFGFNLLGGVVKCCDISQSGACWTRYALAYAAVQ